MAPPAPPCAECALLRRAARSLSRMVGAGKSWVAVNAAYIAHRATHRGVA